MICGGTVVPLIPRYVNLLILEAVLLLDVVVDYGGIYLTFPLRLFNLPVVVIVVKLVLAVTLFVDL